MRQLLRDGALVLCQFIPHYLWKERFTGANLSTCSVFRFCVRRFLGGVIYYYAALNVTNIPGNPYINYTVSSAAELPAALLGMYVVRCWSRRRSMAVQLLLAGLAFVPAPFLPKGNTFMACLLHWSGGNFERYVFIYPQMKP